MAIEKPTLTPPAWANPVWPHRLPDAAQMRTLYGSFADELVVRFDDKWYPDVVVAPITTPRRDYAGLMVASDSGDVIGVRVYHLSRRPWNDILLGELRPSRLLRRKPPAESGPTSRSSLTVTASTILKAASKPERQHNNCRS